mmetsp:Transcript_49913/g.154226  ORF Transcript_49913/g.154226 Transcript_49913/m.154226 type:complete len:229 (+) Transcript_49913:587-1273(+)
MQMAEQREPRTFMILPRVVRACSSLTRAWMRPSSSKNSSRPKASSAWTSVPRLLSSAAALSPPPAAATMARSAAPGTSESRCLRRWAQESRGSALQPRFAAGRHSRRRSRTRRFRAAMSFMVRRRRCSRPATCCCVTGRKKECMLRKGKLTAPKPLSMATTVTPRAPMRAMRRSAVNSLESSWIMRSERNTTYQKAGTAAVAQARAMRPDPNHIMRTEVQTKQKGSST